LTEVGRLGMKMKHSKRVEFPVTVP